MGVRGLTTYIYNNADKFFDNYKLQNSDIVIDGNCLASILFQSSIRNTASFGGDYDRYAKAVEKFVNELLKCKINPIVIFDGGYEKKKLHTVWERNRNKVISLDNIGPTSHSKVCFPLMMRQAFRDKLKEMNILCAQSDFEADSEIAALARKLQCPVLSNDSDFFIYDVTLIPIQDFSLEAERSDDGKHYMSCLVYRVDKFLRSLGGLPRSHLPLLAALLGNDYISSGTFANFYTQMNITRGKKIKQTNERVKAIISWLKKESFESALKKILWHFKKQKQKTAALKIAKIIEGYSKVSTPLDAYLGRSEEYLDIEILKIEEILDQYDAIETQDNPEDLATEDNEAELCPSSEDESGEERVQSNESHGDLDEEQEDSNFPKELVTPTDKSMDPEKSSQRVIPLWLLDHSRRGNIPSSILTLFKLKIYFCNPQVEDYDLDHAGEIGLPILSKIAGVLLGEDIFTYYCRNKKCKYNPSKITTTMTYESKRFPHVSNLCYLNDSQRRTLFLDIYEFNKGNIDMINKFPEQWHLFIFSIIYWAKNMKQLHFKSYHLHSVLIMLLCIRIIENEIGYYRNKRPFMQRYASKIKKTSSSQHKVFDKCEDIDDIIKSISLEEYLVAFEIFLPYFQVEERLKTNSKFFSRTTIHLFAQLQVCLDLAYCLNYLLLLPFPYLPVYNFFNATFLYNFCCNFKKRTNVMSYIETLFVKCPGVLYLYKTMFELVSGVVEFTDNPENGKKKRRRKKNNDKETKNICKSDNTSDKNYSSYSDEDNTFSLLSKLDII